MMAASAASASRALSLSHLNLVAEVIQKEFIGLRGHSSGLFFFPARG